MTTPRTIRTALIAAGTAAALSIAFALPAAAQDAAPNATPTATLEPPPNCPAFADQPDDVRTGYYMGEGIAYLNASRLGEANFSFTCIIRVVDADYAPAYVARGEVYTQLRDYQRALRDYSAALQFDLDAISARNNRGITNAILGDYTTAAADFERVLQTDPDYLPALNNRSVVYALQGNYDAAIELLNTGIAQSGVETALAELRDPNRLASAPPVQVNNDGARLLALRGIIQSARALGSFNDYLTLASAGNFYADERISTAAGSLESRATFELRLDDGGWMIRSTLAGR